jgi:hypothetical protein
MAVLEKMLDPASGFLAGPKLTIADLHFYV